MRGDERSAGGLGGKAGTRDNLPNMTLKIAPHRPTPAQRGFTLVELMIAVVVVGVLLAIALPSFMDSVRKGRRAEAFAALTQVQAAQERERANRAAYLSSVTNAADHATVPGLGWPSDATANGYYTIAIAASSATGYTATATAVSGKSQASDGTCKMLGVRMAGGDLTYGSGASAIDWADPGRCWVR